MTRVQLACNLQARKPQECRLQVVVMATDHRHASYQVMHVCQPQPSNHKTLTTFVHVHVHAEHMC